MNTNVELENIEKDALKILSKANCTGIPCSTCPLNSRKGDYHICVKGICQRLLEDYLNQEV